jgi:hypothetical protein
MPASIIPVTGLIQGPIGTISQSDYPLTTNRLLNPADTVAANFGDTLVLNSNNTYSSVAQFITVDSSSVTGTTGIAFTTRPTTAGSRTRPVPTFPASLAMLLCAAP